jgi:hypothetical protein
VSEALVVVTVVLVGYVAFRFLRGFVRGVRGETFPTDAQVEAAAQAIYDAHQAGAGGHDAARAALVAVRDTMIGDNQTDA